MVYLERWKIILIVAVCVLGVLYALPNALNPNTRAWLAQHAPAFVPHESVNLGLDLRGGSYLLLEVAVDAVVDERMQALVDETRKTLRDKKIGYTNLGLSSGT